MSGASNPFSVEDLTLDPDLNDTDNYGVPDPGLLEERGEPAWPSPRRAVGGNPKRLGQPRTHRAPPKVPGCPPPSGLAAQAAQWR